MSLYIGETTKIVFKTLPYIFLRFLIFTIFGILFLMYLGLVYFMGQTLSGLHQNAREIVWLVGFIISFPIIHLAREYMLYLVKAGHVAVIAELATKGTLPEGVAQIQWGKSQVEARFKQASILFLMDRMVSGTIRAANRMMWVFGNIFQAIPGTRGLIKVANFILYFSLTYVDESILARNFIKTDETIWQSAKTGLVLYAQCWRQVLTTALVLGFISMLFLPLLILLFLTPALAIGVAWPELKIPAILAAIVFSFIIKAVFLDPWTLTNMILTYLKTTEGVAVNLEWEGKLEGISSKFKKLQAKTVEGVPAT